MNKCLYITFQPIAENDGASIKSFAQNEAIKHIGIESHIAYLKNSTQGISFHIDNCKIKEPITEKHIFREIINYIKKNRITIVYIRYTALAKPLFNAFLKRLHKIGITTYMEIPTYPYDKEMKYNTLRLLYQKIREMFFREWMYKYVDKIIVSSEVDFIYHIPTVKISNAPSQKLSIKKTCPIDNCIKMIAVANLAYWHGYDRLIKGISNYYQINHNYDVELTIAGKGNKEVYDGLTSLTKKLGLEDKIHFIGSKRNDELDSYFNQSHLAIGCLACHRKGIKEVRALKNVEYAMRGIPFVYSESNPDFDERPYVIRVSADDTDVNVETLCEFVLKNNLQPKDISDSVQEYTWENQMKKVFATFLD